MSVMDHSYGMDQPSGIEYKPGVTNVNFDDVDLYAQLDNPRHPNHQHIKRFLTALGLCHTVITDTKIDDDGTPYTIYNASSPDELALVNGARHLGFAFLNRDDDGNMVCEAWGEEIRYKLLNVIEFDSTRKRMSVIVRTPDGRILVICKGADSIIEKRLKANQGHLETTKGFLDDFAKTGLRTLLIASKEISEDNYNKWQLKYLKAATSDNKEAEMNRVAEQLEVEFDLIGSTAIEDKLQEDVGQTIYDIRQAGIKVWVLTGDKVETAMNIGHACRLLESEMNMFLIQKMSHKGVTKEIEDAY